MSGYDAAIDSDVDELSSVLITLVAVERYQGLICHYRIETYQIPTRPGPGLGNDKRILTSNEGVVFEPRGVSFRYAAIEQLGGRATGPQRAVNEDPSHDWIPPRSD